MRLIVPLVQSPMAQPALASEMDLRVAAVRRQGADRALLDGLHTSTPEMLRRLC